MAKKRKTYVYSFSCKNWRKRSLGRKGAEEDNIKIDLKQVRRILIGIIWHRKEVNDELVGTRY
jgi:hypothetical protein